MLRDVVVTGLGVVSPLGTGVEKFWARLVRGDVGTGPITLFDASVYLTDQGGEVRDCPVPRGEDGNSSRSEAFALRATSDAMLDSNSAAAHTLADFYDRSRVGVCFGTVMGNRPSLDGPLRQAGPWAGAALMADRPWRMSATIAAEFRLGGPTTTMLTACASGNSAISQGASLIRSGCCDAMLVGGADELSEATFMMFNSLRAFAPRWVQPFDLERRGLLLAEGAGALVLEAASSACARGAHSYGQVAGYGSLSDGYHVTAPHPQGAGAIRSMAAALAMSGLPPSRLDYINAHGTGTRANDVAEAIAIRTVLAGSTDRVPVTSLKSMLGHAQGAASAIEAAACLLSMRDSAVPFTANTTVQDPMCQVTLVVTETLRRPVRAVMNNAFGFGGNNCCVVFTAPEPLSGAA